MDIHGSNAVSRDSDEVRQDPESRTPDIRVKYVGNEDTITTGKDGRSEESKNHEHVGGSEDTGERLKVMILIY